MEELTTATGQRIDYQFPQHFLWGAATAAHQVEGDNRWNDWWEYEQAGRLPHQSGACCSHYELYEQDFDLARGMGHNCHRFSVEWSRIEPAEGQWDEQALQHYRGVVQALRSRTLEPVLTLHHFTNPAWFTQRGGWLSGDCIQLFLRFVERVVDELSGDVRYWITINEPTVYILQSYINGKWPPLEQGALFKATRAARNLARAHVAAYKTIKSREPDHQVGFAHSALVIEPCDPGRRRDRVAAWARDFALNRLFFRLIGEDGRARGSFDRSLDFIGLNYYTRCCVRSSGIGVGALFGRACKLLHHERQGCVSSTGWEVYPAGLGATLSRYARFGLPLFITENGIATDDDKLRCEFLEQHLEELARAMEGGVKIIGYLHWSLMDNFEWDMGTSPRFGLAAVAPGTKERSPRRSAELLAQVCRENKY